MKFTHVAVSACFALFCYFALGTVWGEGGTQEKQELSLYRDRLTQSIASLEMAKAELQDELERMLHDPARLEQEAHLIGMSAPGEIRVRLPSKVPDAASDTLHMATKPSSNALGREIMALIALIAGTTVWYLLSMLFKSGRTATAARQPRSSHNAQWYQGIRVQTASRE